LVADVRVGGWAKPWNVKSDRSVGDAPGSSYWATDKAGFGQVGCVYTAQGFDYDWSGVILGPDLVARDGRLAPCGMRGTLVYSTDDETREYLAGLVRPVRSTAVRYAPGR
jgi:uncharacterized protein